MTFPEHNHRHRRLDVEDVRGLRACATENKNVDVKSEPVFVRKTGVVEKEEESISSSSSSAVGTNGTNGTINIGRHDGNQY